MAAKVEGGIERWLERTAPFQASLANPKHLLDPLLESYRAYRKRLLRGDEDEAAGREESAERIAAAGGGRA
jgi:hypothetical protein